MTLKTARSLLVVSALLPVTALAQFKHGNVTALRLLKSPQATEITPGKDYDLEGYGLMFGLHVGSDEGRFSHVKIKGDFDVSVRIESISNDEKAFTEAGLMVRRSLHPCDLMIGLSTTSNEYVGEADQYTFMRRTKFAGFLFNAAPAPFEGGMGNDAFSYIARGYNPDNQARPRPFPKVWLRLQRTGNTYASYTRENAEDWRKIGEFTLDLGEEPFVGMFITANHHSKSATVGNPAARALVKFRDLAGFPLPPVPSQN